MRRKPLLIIASTVVVALGVATAGVASAATSGSLTVTTRGRGGGQVAATVSIVSSAGTANYSVASGKTRSLPKGTYSVLVDIWDEADGSDTLAAQVVKVSGKTAITFDARQGKPLNVSLDTPLGDDYHQSFNDIRICAGSMLLGQVEAYGTPGKVFVIGNTSKQLQFAFLSSWTSDDPAADAYTVSAGIASLPTKPNWQFRKASLGTLRMWALHGPAGSPFTSLALQPQARSCQGDLFVESASGDAPLTRIVHVSPGTWEMRADTTADDHGQSAVIGNFSSVKAVAAGKTYSQAFFRSAWGPAQNVPYVSRKALTFGTGQMFTDPGFSGLSGEASERSTVTLKLKSTLLATKTRTDWGSSDTSTFSYKLKKAGWYSLSVVAKRYRPGIHYPSDMLSTMSTATFNFRADPAKSVYAPVWVTRFVPGGLDLNNTAKAGSTTTVALVLDRRRNDGHSLPALKLKTLAVKASYDNGKTWRTATVKRAGSGWVALVPNPASGAVTLRSTATDKSGSNSVTTVYRAYAVS